MPVIAVINRKGGSGKSTLATHLAAFCASRSLAVMLGDVDRQQSSRAWLKARETQALALRHPIRGWSLEAGSVFRAPVGTTHVILDTPGGLQGLELARVVMSCDALLMPVCNGMFDRESAAQCLAELRTLPRIASGRCAMAAIGMRINAASSPVAKLLDWAAAQQIELVGMVGDSARYVGWAENGQTLFDAIAGQEGADFAVERAEWQPILKWLGPILGLDVAEAMPAAAELARPARPKQPMLTLVDKLDVARAAVDKPAVNTVAFDTVTFDKLALHKRVLKPLATENPAMSQTVAQAQKNLPHGPALPTTEPPEAAPPTSPRADPRAAPGALPIPRFLQRG